MRVLAELPADVSTRAACDALGVSRATFYRARDVTVLDDLVSGPTRRRRVPAPTKRLDDTKRATIIELVRSEEFADQPPRAVVAALLSQGRYVCSVRTMYRILASLGESHERRAQHGQATYEALLVRATAPNEVWVWDITALPARQRGQFCYLYAVMDLYSRFVVAWHVTHAQNGDLAERLFVDACATYDIAPASLCVDSDRGSPMTLYRLTRLFEQLGATASYSRPRVSDDNPHIESQFKTLKYQPGYPSRFQAIQQAVSWCEEYYAWNNYARHSAPRRPREFLGVELMP